ncbi:GspE/PulE family protein [uncultured Croceitalea sp.]|uniref:GspE/PulE family protein n=1 Tax=uncultured Croceitalea sp. TaxID=1798908 RepID=UPI00330582A0
MKADFKIPNAIAQRISAEQAFHYRIVPKQFENDMLTFKTDSDNLKNLLAELRIILGYPLHLEKVSSDELQNFLTTNYRIAKADKKSELSYSADFLDKILVNAKNIGSSDIHFEPYENDCRVRFRLDGKLIEQFSITKKEYPIIVNKIKIKAELDIAEKRLPQDGRISVKTLGDDFDIRVSCLPTLFGEKIVLRILNRNTDSIHLENLGFTKDELTIYKEGIKKPNGIVLISGPTGSGKTTTLYATLKLLNNSANNILTIEDPIEYTLEGVNQVQLKENIGLDFATSLRTFLRQDPDIIMVGEIRDVKTANMAIRAALTGHLVLSTIHTNSAWGTISRLIDMGVPPFLIANTLNTSVAQRLIRKLCPHCKKEEKLTQELLPINYKLSIKLTTHFKAIGCPKCYHTGYSGRKAIYEILPVTNALSHQIKNNALEINSYLKDNKIATLHENAIQMVKEGLTSIDEVYSLLTD